MPTPKFANLQAILAEESDAETGVVSENAEERLEVEMRKVLIDFFERYFLWCALFHPVEGSRGMRAETMLTRFGKVVCGLRRKGSGVRQLAVGKDVSSFSAGGRKGSANSAPNAYCLTPDPCEAS